MTGSENFVFFSVVIPTYNRSELLSHTLDALSMQSFSDFEVIIVDDGGKDGTMAMVSGRSDARLHYHHVSNRERGAARNFGASCASGRYITFLDSDDIPHPDFLENAFETIKASDTPPFVCLGYRVATTGMKTLYAMNELKSNDASILEKGNPFSCICNFLRKDIVALFPFNEDRELSGSEDWELWLRLVAHHGYTYNPAVSASLINHESRSVIHTDVKSLLKRKELALRYSFTDPKVGLAYGHAKSKIEAFADSYISLHLALAGHRSLAVRYLAKAIVQYPLMIFDRRPLVILKRILLGR